jgi:rubrerythrin
MTPVNPDTLSALTSGIQAEVASYVFYVEASKKNEAARIKDVLQKLALEEKQHFQVLERQYDSLVRSEKWISTADILKQKGLPEIGEEMSTTHRALIDEVAQTNSLSAILDIAYRLEVEARDIYVTAGEKCQSREGQQVFAQLVKFEEGHMKIISEMKKKYT